MGANDYVAAVDRMLTRAHALFPAPDAADVLAASANQTTIPDPPPSASALTSGADLADGTYRQAQTATAAIDLQSSQAATEGAAIGAQGHAGSAAIRDSARLHAQALIPMTKSPAGTQLLVAAMDEHIWAMQRQLDTTTTQNRFVASRLRQNAAD
jgi:peptidoglycan DL-endopeptidase CwlO